MVVTGRTRQVAAASPLLRPLREGIYDAYSVVDPVTTVTFGDQNATLLSYGNRRIEAMSERSGSPVVARINWYPRWEATVDNERAETERLDDGYVGIASAALVSKAELVYSVQPLDWAARALSLLGVIGLGWLLVQRDGRVPGIGAGMLNGRGGAVRPER